MGSRNSRLYDAETIYLAAVLFRISDLGIDAAVIKEISAFLQSNSHGQGGFARFWRDAKKPIKVPDAYLQIYLSYYRQPIFKWNDPRKKFSCVDLLPDDEAPAIILNLRVIFEEVEEATDRAQQKRRPRNEP
jgi:hypothetical protein